MMADEINPLLQDSGAQVQVPQYDESNPLLVEQPVSVAPQREPKRPLDWSEVPMEAVKNIPSSGWELAKGMAHPFLHPIETAGTIKDIAVGLGSKAAGAIGVPQEAAAKAQSEAVVDALGRYYAQRYGTMEGFKEAVAKDPVGLLADASVAFTGGGSLAARAPGVIGKAGEAAALAGKAINPVAVAGKAAAPIVEGAAKATAYPLAVTTGAPVETLQTAIKAGKEGSVPFMEQITGRADPSVIVDAAHDAVNQLAAKRRSDYLNSMEGMKANQTQLSYDKINQAIANAYKDVTHGSITHKPEAKDMLDKIYTAVLDWQTTPNSSGVNYHNLEGVDKLKQLVGEIRSSAQPGSSAEAMGTKIYNAIKNTLTQHDPNYQRAMGSYGEASDTLNQMKKTLSINNQASIDTTLRKLLLGQKQVDGQKASLLKQLNEVNPELSNMIAGHILHPGLPIGFRGGIGAALAGAGAIGANAGMAGNVPAIVAHAAMQAAASSPRIVGEAAYKVGQAVAPGTTGATVPLLALSGIQKKPEDAQVPAVVQQADRARPYFPGPDEIKRKGRATGGAVNLTALAKSARKHVTLDTKPLLGEHDETVARALEIAGKHI